MLNKSIESMGLVYLPTNWSHKNQPFMKVNIPPSHGNPSWDIKKGEIRKVNNIHLHTLPHPFISPQGKGQKKVHKKMPFLLASSGSPGTKTS